MSAGRGFAWPRLQFVTQMLLLESEMPNLKHHHLKYKQLSKQIDSLSLHILQSPPF